MTVTIKTNEEIKKMRVAGRLASQVLDFIHPRIRAGVTTEEIDNICHDYMVNVQKTVPAPLNYAPPGHTPFPKSICTSVNHVVCHGIPNSKTLKNGDIVNIDVTVIVDGWHGDTSRMYPIGEINRKAERLINITYESLLLGIAEVKPGKTTGDIGYAIQRYAEKERCSVVQDFCGHGLGRLFHDAPNILHFGRPGEGETLKEGMFFTIEPMINLGRPDVKILSDGWTAVTRDKKLTAQFEHSIGVTKNGCEIFTSSPKGLDKPPY